jgi:hypothetical protein
MKSDTHSFVQNCLVCQQSKPSRVKYPRLLAPLPIPDGAWQVIFMDFIEALPISGSTNCILVVVDKFSKYSHFIALHHPFTARVVAQAFLDNVYKLHGLSATIISEGSKKVTRGRMNVSQSKFSTRTWPISQNRQDTPLFYIDQDHKAIEELLVLETGLGNRKHIRNTNQNE